MHLHEIQVLGADAGLLIDGARRVGRHPGGTDDRADEEVARGVALGLQLRGRDAHDGTPGPQPPRDLRTPDDRRRGAVADRAGHHRGQRPRDHPRAEHLLGRHRLLGLALAHRVERAVVPVLGGDRGQVLGLGPPLVHAPRRPQREERGGQDRVLEPGGIRRPARRLDHRGHLVEAEHHDDVVTAAGDGEARLAEGGRAGGGGVLDVLDGDAGQPELLHGARSAHDRREDVADVGGLDVAEREARVAQRRHARLASHVGVRLLRPHAEPVHADAEDRDVLHDATGRKRMITTSWPASSRSGSSSAATVWPTR